MMMLAFCVVVVLVTLVVAFGQPEREKAWGLRRWMWMMVGIGLLEMLLLPTWPQRMMLYLVLLHVQLSFPPSAHERFLMQVLIVVGAYLAFLPVVSSGEWTGMVTPFLWLLVGLGCITGLWAIYTRWKRFLDQGAHENDTYYSVQNWKIGAWTYEMLERPSMSIMTAGHLNSNFTQPLVCIFLAANLGLIAQGVTWAGWFLPVLAAPLLVHVFAQRMPGQWVVQLFVLLCLVLFHYYGWLVVMVVGTLGSLLMIGTFFRGFKLQIEAAWWDSGRFYEWWHCLRLWWGCQSWAVRCIGGGIRSWLQASVDLARFKATPQNNYLAPLFSAAHNEYIQQLFEYGVIGFVALGWYVVDVLVKAHALSLGLFWVTVMLAASALLTFPWTFYHTVVIENPLQDGRVQVTQTSHGSPLLVWLTFLITLLVEA